MLAHGFGFLHQLFGCANHAPVAAANTFGLHGPVRCVQPEFVQRGRLFVLGISHAGYGFGKGFHKPGQVS